MIKKKKIVCVIIKTEPFNIKYKKKLKKKKKKRETTKETKMKQ